MRQMCRSSWPWLTSKNDKIQAQLKRAMMKAWEISTLMRQVLSPRRKMTRTKKRKRIESISYFVVFSRNPKINQERSLLFSIRHNII